MSDQKSNAATGGQIRQFVISRDFDAPREKVFAAWTDPDQMARWWGPRGFNCPVCEMDVRAGGAYRIIMRSPDGIDYPMNGEFAEIAPPERLVMTMDCSEHPAAWHDMVKPGRAKNEANPAGKMLMTATFEQIKSKTKQTTAGTRLTIRVQFESNAIADAMLKLGMTEGWSLSLDKLTENLASGAKPATDREIVFTRVLNAPPELVWEAWTNPRHVAKWWGPRGFSTTIQEMDVRPGGAWNLIMHGPDGTPYPNASTFTEIVKPSRLSYSHSGAKKGGADAQFQMTATFDDLGGDKTLLTMRMVFPSAVLRDQVVKEYGAIEGGKQTLDRLTEYLPTMP